MFVRWNLTVCSATHSSLPIASLERPRASALRIEISRSVSPAALAGVSLSSKSPIAWYTVPSSACRRAAGRSACGRRRSGPSSFLQGCNRSGSAGELDLLVAGRGMTAADLRRAEPIRVLVASERATTRRAVRDALEPGAFCLEAETVRAAIDHAIGDEVDVCLIDARMKGDGIAAASAIRERRPDALIVVLAPVEDEAELLEAVSAGAVGYMGDEVDPSRLESIVRGVVRGEAAVPRKLVA